MLVSTKSVKTKRDLDEGLIWDTTHSAPQRFSLGILMLTHTTSRKQTNKQKLVPQKTAALERLAGDAGEDKKLLDTGLTEKMAALPEQAAK